MRKLHFGDLNRALLSVREFSRDDGSSRQSATLIEAPFAVRLDPAFKNTLIRSFLGRLNYRNRESIDRLVGRARDLFPGETPSASISLLDIWIGFADELLTKREAYFVKAEKFEIWRQYFQACDQDLVPVADLARKLARTPSFGIADLAVHLRNWRTFVSGDDRQFQLEMAKGFACQHLHLSGAYPAPYYWVALMNGRFDPTQILTVLSTEARHERYDSYDEVKKLVSDIERAREIRLALYRLAARIAKDENTTDEQIVADFSVDRAAANKAQPVAAAAATAKAESKPEWRACFEDKTRGSATRTDYAQSIVAGAHPGLDIFTCPSLVGERALNTIILTEIQKRYAQSDAGRDAAKAIAQSLWSYLQAKSGFLGTVEQKEGITGFDYFEYTLRLSPWTDEINEQERCAWEIATFLQETGALTKLEFMIAPQQTSEDYDAKLSFIKRIGEHLKTRANPDLKRVHADPKTGVIVHFIKTAADGHAARRVEGENVLRIFHYSLRDDMAEKSKVLADFLSRSADTQRRFSVDGSATPRIVAIDAANRELYCPPEIFADTFRLLGNVAPLGAQGALRKTFHVGEDFAYVTTGLRRIYEAIQFLGIGPGDRLGHCVALGANARQWLHDNPTVPLHAIDILDDAIFEWHLLLDDPQASPRRFQNLENRMATYSMKIFGEAIAPRVLEKAWLRRGDCFRVQDKRFADRDSIPAWIRAQGRQLPSGRSTRGTHSIVPVAAIKREEVDGTEWPEDYFAPLDMADRILKEYLYDPHTIQRAVQIEMVDVLAEAEFIEAVQRSLSKLVAARGITIESNPSSNWLIAGFEQLSDVPAVQWMLRDPDFPISINPDDPVTFGTCPDNEYFFLYACLLKGDARNTGLSREKALDIVRRLRERALETSFI